MKEQIIECKNLTKYYDKLLAVNNITFSINKGDFFGFLGPNGAGKTTTIKMITGLISITKGKVRIFNRDLISNLNYIKQRLGIVEDTSNLFFDLTVSDNLMFKARMLGVPKKLAQKRISEYLEIFNLSNKLKTKFIFLSKGQKRIITIISALIHKPDILFLDEPTIGLDINVRNYIYKFLLDLNKQGTTIFLTSHYFDEVEKLCSNIAVINKGNIIFKGKIDKLKSLFSYESEIVIKFNKKVPSLKVKKYFDSFKIKNNELYLKENVTPKLFTNLGNFIKESNLKALEINSIGKRLEDLFLKLLKKDNGAK